MVATVLLSPSLQPFAAGRREHEVAGRDVGELLARLAERFPPLRERLFHETGGLRGYLVVLIEDQDIRALGGLAAPVPPDAVVTILPAVAGGWS